MANLRNLLSNKSFLYLGLLVFSLVSFFILSLIIGSENSRFYSQQRSGALEASSAIRAQMEQSINQRLFLADSLESFVVGHEYDHDHIREEFELFASVLVENHEDVRSIQLAPEAVVELVYPLKGNEAAIGHNLLVDDVRRESVLDAVNNNEYIVTGPIDLIQGGSAFIARLPIYYEESGESYGLENFWGFATVLIDTHVIFGDLDNLKKNSKYNFALRGRDGLGESGDVFYGDPDLFNEEPVLQYVTLPDGVWQIATVPMGGWGARASSASYILIIGIILILSMDALLLILATEPRRLREKVEQATREISEAREFLDQIANSIDSGILVEDENRRVLYVNNYFLKIFDIDLPPEKLVGADCVSAMEKSKSLFKKHEEFVSKTNSIIETRKPHEEEEWELVDGRFFYRIYKPIFLDGRFLGSMWIYRDITEKKKISDMKTDFVSLVSHQLKTPVAQIKGYVANMLDGLTGPLTDKQKEYLNDMDRVAAANGSLIDALLNVSRIERGVISFDKQEVDMKILMDEILDPLYVVAKSKDVRLKISLPNEEMKINVDMIKTKEAIRNIVDNAIKFSPEGGVVGVEVSTKGPRAAVSISDQGPGIDKDVQTEVFAKDRVWSGKVKAAGSGLGLYLAKKFITLQNGTIDFKTSDKGTTFSVTFPIKNE